MNSQERRTASIVGLLYFVRMLGLFSILPVFALAAAELFDSGPAAIGLTLGIYGLFQAVLQIPLGALSDRFGRKPILIGGLLVFIIGSLIAALAQRIEWIVLGRALQGSGAIAGVLLAVVGDGLRLEYRARAMAMIGGGIGLAFGFSLVVGPLLYQFGGLAALFFLAAITGMLALVLVLFFLPELDAEYQQPRSSGGVVEVLRDGALQTLNLSIFMNHFLLMAGFVVIPALLEKLGLLKNGVVNKACRGRCRASHRKVPVRIFQTFTAIYAKQLDFQPKGLSLSLHFSTVCFLHGFLDLTVLFFF